MILIHNTYLLAGLIPARPDKRTPSPTKQSNAHRARTLVNPLRIHRKDRMT